LRLCPEKEAAGDAQRATHDTVVIMDHERPELVLAMMQVGL